MAIGEEVLANVLATRSAKLDRSGGVAQQLADRCAERGEIGWVIDEQPCAAILDLLLVASEPAGHDRPRLHSASVTPSPKPSWRLFLTTTAASRRRALTISAFSSRSAIGRMARLIRAR